VGSRVPVEDPEHSRNKPVGIFIETLAEEVRALERGKCTAAADITVRDIT
jgi:hypothetical protein